MTTPTLDGFLSIPVTVRATAGVRHDEFSIVFYNQGCALSSEDTTCAFPLNVKCPYHGVVLFSQLHDGTTGQKRALSATEHGLLENMPPASFTRDHRLGTSVSCRCNCGQNEREDLQPFSEDINKIVENFGAETSNQNQ
jgi:hypothetical protein